MRKTAELMTLNRASVELWLRSSTWLWKRLPSGLRKTPPMLWYGTILHRHICGRANRMQFTHTVFFRNRPELELMRRLIAVKPAGSTVKIAVLGCSIGAEVYSIALTIRRARPDLKILMHGVDNSAPVLKVATEAVYTQDVCELVGSSIFERMTESEFRELFEGDRREARVRSSIREGVSWHLSDAGDPRLLESVGHQDIVVGSNFLCHMEPVDAESCLRNMAMMVKPGGYLFVTGVDLDVREKAAHSLGWRPVLDMIEEIHDGDPSIRQDWPCAWWGLEPIDTKRRDWQMRYASVFQRNEGD